LTIVPKVSLVEGLAKNNAQQGILDQPLLTLQHTTHMKQLNIDLILIRFFQFILFAVFIFIVIVYFCTLLFIPLDLLFQLQRVLVFIGIPAVVSVLLTGGFVVYAGLTLKKKPEIWRYMLDTGTTLFNFAVEQVKGMEQMAIAAKQQAPQD
jgi:hypothetical protein